MAVTREAAVIFAISPQFLGFLIINGFSIQTVIQILIHFTYTWMPSSLKYYRFNCHFWFQVRSQSCEKRLSASTCLSVHPHGFHKTDVHEIWYLGIFLKYSDKIQVSFKSDKNKLFYMKTYTYLWQYSVEFFLEWEMFQTTFVKKIKTYIWCSIFFFFPKILPGFG